MFSNRDETFFYAKERRLFGRQCIFADHNELMFDEAPNRTYMDQYILKNPAERSTQLHNIFALSECATINPEMKSHGINHIEGGWPKDLNPLDEEQTTRQRKKIMRDDIWGQKVPNLIKTMEKSVLQNGAVNIYEKYFDGMHGIPPRDEFCGKTVNIYRDKMEDPRPISSLTWSPDGTFLAGSYSMPKFKETASLNPTSYIWSIDNSNRPFVTVNPKTPCLCLQYNSRDQFLLAGGLVSGEVVIFDQRVGGKPILLAEREVAHSDRVNSLLWTSSKTNTEFFSGSADGSVFYWDTRNMAAPTEHLLLDPAETNDQVKSRSYGVSVLGFEPTIPTRFMIGTDQGHVFTCNRKGKTAMEKIIAKFKTNTGSIYSLERNPSFPKNFLAVGDWTAKLWCDEWRDAAIIWMGNRHVPVLSGTWSRTRCSLFFITKHDGSFEAWDLLIQQNSPVVKIKLTDYPLFCCAAHENGELIAASGSNGFIYLVRVSDNMVTSSKIERPAFMAMVEREARREKSFDSRLREVKLKMRQEQEKREEQERQLELQDPEKMEARKKAEEEKKLKEEEEQKKKQAENRKKEEEEAEKDTKESSSAPSKPTESEEPGDLQATVVPHGGPPNPSSADDAEVLVDLIKDDEDEFYANVKKEIDKRGAYLVIPVATPFDPDFDMTTIMKPEDIEEERRRRIRQIKAKVITGLLELCRQNKNHNEEE